MRPEPTKIWGRRDSDRGWFWGRGCCCGCFAGIGEGEVLEGREVLGVRVIFV